MGADQSKAQNSSTSGCISLLERTPRDFLLSSEAKACLENLEGPCYVISISGKSGSGKSTLLNLLLSFFSNQIDGKRLVYKAQYEVGNDDRPTTAHIDICVVSVENKNFILLDMEGSDGFNRPEDGPWVDGSLLRIAVGASQLHIHNFSDNIGRQILADFKFINQLARVKGLEPKFSTKHILLKRKCVIDNSQIFKEKLNSFKDNQPEEAKSMGSFSYILTNPPSHMLDVKSSCLAKGYICENCLKNFFFEVFSEFFEYMQKELLLDVSFENGKQVLTRLENILDINRKEFQYFKGIGDSTSIALAQAKKDQIEILDALNTVKLYGVEQRTVLQQVEGFPKNWAPKGYMNEKVHDKHQEFCKIWIDIQFKIRRMETFLPFLEKFIKNSLINNNYGIYSEAQKDCLITTYADKLEELTNQILESSSDYLEAINFIKEKSGEWLDIRDQKDSLAKESIFRSCYGEDIMIRKISTSLKELNKISEILIKINDESSYSNSDACSTIKDLIQRKYDGNFMDDLDISLIEKSLPVVKEHLSIFRKSVYSDGEVQKSSTLPILP